MIYTFGADKRKNMPPCKSFTISANCVVRTFGMFLTALQYVTMCTFTPYYIAPNNSETVCHVRSTRAVHIGCAVYAWVYGIVCSVVDDIWSDE